MRNIVLLAAASVASAIAQVGKVVTDHMIGLFAGLATLAAGPRCADLISTKRTTDGNGMAQVDHDRSKFVFAIP